MKSGNIIAPLLTIGLLAGACSAENTQAASSADIQLLDAYSDCKIVKAEGSDTVAANREDGASGRYGRADIELSVARNPQTDNKQIHYGSPIGYLTLNGVAATAIGVELSWQRYSDNSPSQTSAYIEPSLEALTGNPFTQVQNAHEEVAVYVSAQNNDPRNEKTSGRYCGTIVMRETPSGGIEAEMIQPLKPPAETILRNDWFGDMHCTIAC